MKQNQTKEIINQAIRDAVKELGLKQYPRIKFVDDEFAMGTTGEFVYVKRGLFGDIITESRCDYILRLNKREINKLIKQVTFIFGNKQAAYDYVYLLVCHELRHMWQYENGFFIGRPLKNHDVSYLFKGHGSTPEEVDANKFMVEMAKHKNIEKLAKYMIYIQNYDGVSNKFDTNFRKEAHYAYIEAVNKYNKLFGLLFK